MAKHDPISVDPRIVSPLVCNPEYGLSRWPSDSLNRAKLTLRLLADLLCDYNGERDLLADSDTRFTIYLQLSSLSDVIEAVSDAVTTLDIPLHLRLHEEECGILRNLAARHGLSVYDMGVALIRERLATVSVGGAQ